MSNCPHLILQSWLRHFQILSLYGQGNSAADKTTIADRISRDQFNGIKDMGFYERQGGDVNGVVKFTLNKDICPQ